MTLFRKLLNDTKVMKWFCFVLTDCSVSKTYNQLVLRKKNYQSDQDLDTRP